MSEQQDQRTDHGEGWPSPSPEVLRELEPPALSWSEPEWPLSQPSYRPARG